MHMITRRSLETLGVETNPTLIASLFQQNASKENLTLSFSVHVLTTPCVTPVRAPLADAIHFPLSQMHAP